MNEFLVFVCCPINMSSATYNNLLLYLDKLGSRLEASDNTALSSNAVLCYICSGNIEKFAEGWVRQTPDNGSSMALQVRIKHADLLLPWGVIGMPKSAPRVISTMVKYVFLKNHSKSHGIWFALVLKCNKKVSQCPEWSLNARLMLFRLLKGSSELFILGSTRFFGQSSITPLNLLCCMHTIHILVHLVNYFIFLTLNAANSSLIHMNYCYSICPAEIIPSLCQPSLVAEDEYLLSSGPDRESDDVASCCRAAVWTGICNPSRELTC